MTHLCGFGVVPQIVREAMGIVLRSCLFLVKLDYTTRTLLNGALPQTCRGYCKYKQTILPVMNLRIYIYLRANHGVPPSTFVAQAAFCWWLVEKRPRLSNHPPAIERMPRHGIGHQIVSQASKRYSTDANICSWDFAGLSLLTKYRLGPGDGYV